jgi:hypothetical protein
LEWLGDSRLIDIVLPPPLRINKYMWFMLYIFRFLSSIFIIVLLRPHTDKQCWHTCSATHATVWEQMSNPCNDS